MRLCGIRGKDYICISNDVRELPDFFKFASTDSLVTPSNAPDGIGFPISHLGSAFLAASKNAFRYARSYCCMVYPAANRSFFFTLRCKFVYTSDRFVVSPFKTPFSRRNSFLVCSNISSLLLSGMEIIRFRLLSFSSVTKSPANPVVGSM